MADTTNPDYDKIVADAYATIGRTGVGDAVSNIDQGGLDYWKGLLSTGTLTPENFNSAFGNAVEVYKRDNPNDPYTQYVQNYQAQQANAGGYSPPPTSSNYFNVAPTVAAANQNSTNPPVATQPSYYDQIVASNPDAAQQIKNLAQNTADESYGGQIQDWQVQLFTPLDTTKVGAPKQLKTSTSYQGVEEDTGNPVTYEGASRVVDPNVTALYGSDESGQYVTGYQSQTPTNINGINVYAQYDANGNLTGYTGDKTTWMTPSSRATAQWDATGQAKPATWQRDESGWGGFLGGALNDIGGAISGITSSLGPAWTIAKIVNPELNLVDAGANLAQGKLNTNTALSGALGYAGLQASAANDIANSTSGIDIGSGVSPAVAAAQNAQNIRLGVSAASAYEAAKTGNYAPLLAAGANISGINQMPEVATALNTMSAATAIANKDYASALSAAGALTNSPDLKLAGSATKFINAYSSGNPNAIAIAAMELGQVAENNAKQNGAAKTVFDALGGAKTIDTSKLTPGSTITPEGPSTKTSEVTGVDVNDLSKGVQVAGPGGLDQGGFKPGTPTQTATGMFFTTPDGHTYPITVNKETGMMTSTDPAGAEAVKQFKINDTSGIKDIFFDKTPINPNLSSSETTALSKVTGKSSGDVTDVEAKNASPEVKQQAQDLGNTLLEKIKGGAGVGDMLRMIGGLDTAENATALYLAKQIPELKTIMDNAQNSGYIQDLEEQLATDPTDPNWLQEYKGLTGKDYKLPAVDLGEIVITGSRIKDDGTTENAGEITDQYTNPYSGVKVTTQVDSKTGTKTETDVDPKTKITTQTTTTPDTSVQVVIDPTTNTQTKTTTDLKTNTSTTVKIDTKTGVVTVVPTEVKSTGTGGGTKVDTSTPTSTPSTPTSTSSTPASTKLNISGGGGSAPVGGNGEFLAPEPFKTHFIKQDFKPLNPTLFALAGIDPLKGTLEEKLSEQPEKKMPTLADLVFAPSAQQSTGLPPASNPVDGGDGPSAPPSAPATADLPDAAVPAYAHGGLTGLHPMGEPQFYSQGGLGNMHVQGDGDGTSDSVPAMVAKDEFVLPADVVASLGNGSSEAGASVLDHFVEIIRQHKHSNPPSELPPPSKGPLEYLSSAMKKGHA